MITRTLLSLLLVSVVGCSTSDDWQPTVLDGAVLPPSLDGAPPKQDNGLPKQDIGVPKKDTGTPPKKDTGTPPKLDTGTPPKLDTGTPPKLDTGTPPKLDSGPPPVLTNKVAAIQYGSGQQAQVKASCTTDPMPDVCALKELVSQAKGKGASYVVLPEYGTGQPYYEPTPALGENPATNAAWPADMIIKIFSSQAKQLGIYLVLNLLTYEGTKPNYVYHNTNIAFEPTGKVVGLHRKFNLFGSETQTLTPGNSVSVFSTPLGKMGMLICADIYGSTTLMNKLGNTLQARVVAVSSFWTTTNPVNTYYKTYLGKYPYYSVIANTTIPPGYGGGVFYGPGWQALDAKIGSSPSIAVATIPWP